MRSEIEKAFKARYPGLKDNQVSKAVKKYVDVVTQTLASSIVSYGFEENNEIPLAVDNLRIQVGKITNNGKQDWILPMMRANPDTKLYDVKYTGNEGKVSRVTLNPKYEKEIMQELIDLNFELSPLQIKQMLDNATTWTPCDPDSIDAFIHKSGITYTETVQKNDPKQRVYLEALARNLMIAQQLKEQAIFQDGQYLLPEVYWVADSGRMYGKGLSLQRVPKMVRHAALGMSWSYDFKASCYALMTGLALQIDPDLKVAALLEYITNRERMRKHIAKSIGVTEKKIKGIFSSLGFGAMVVDNPHMSIRKELGAERYEMLMQNKEFHYINQAFKLVQGTILEHFKSNDFEFLGRQYDPIDPTSEPLKPKKRNNNQKLAWIYQAMESRAIADFAIAACQVGHQPLLFAHDCVYFKRKIAVHHFHSILSELRRDFPLLQIEAEEIIPIHDGTGPVQDAFNRYEEMIDTHKAFVDAEEMLADAEFVKLGDKIADPLDTEHGYFAQEIKALNPEPKTLGTSFKLPGSDD